MRREEPLRPSRSYSCIACTTSASVTLSHAIERVISSPRFVYVEAPSDQSVCLSHARGTSPGHADLGRRDGSLLRDARRKW